MVLDATNTGQYMRVGLNGADPVTHKGINLASADRVDIASGQSLNLLSQGGGGIYDTAPGVGASNVLCELGFVNIQGGDLSSDISVLQVNPLEVDITSLLTKITGVVNVVGTLQVNGVPVTVP
jgi:hypothetical protein